MRNRLKHDIRMAELLETGLMMIDGHFDYHNGYHGGSYLNPHIIMHDPALFMQYARELKDSIPSDIQSEGEVIVGPATGGMLLAQNLAITIDASRDFGPRKLFFAPLHKQDGELQIRHHYRELVRGKKVILVDDVIHTGLTMVKAKSLLMRHKATVIATASLFDRNVRQVELERHFALQVCEDRTELPVLASECPYCKLGQPITQF